MYRMLKTEKLNKVRLGCHHIDPEQSETENACQQVSVALSVRMVLFTHGKDRFLIAFLCMLLHACIFTDRKKKKITGQS